MEGEEMNKQEHLLVCLAEECAEVTHVVSKILRFGLENRHPKRPELGTNRERLTAELTDVTAIIEMVQKMGLLTEEGISWNELDKKREKVEKYMDIARSCGTLASIESYR